ncbi:MAG TPA: hypothetical protein VGD69_24320, partial [Herpetosiphonaceae bacterium]
RQLPLTMIASITAEDVARRFKIAGKGSLTIGTDADLALVDLADRSILESSDLFYRHRHSPYLGKTLHGRVVRTLVRGTTVFMNGKVDPAPIGRLLTPRRAE